MSEPFYLGADLGGTQLRMAAVTRDGRLASELLSVATGRDFGPSELQAQIAALAGRLRAAIGGPFVGLGFGSAGVIQQGPLTQIENLPRLNGVDVTELVRGVAGCPVRIENDARCFALAEARFGAGRGARHLCGITLGTGVGCGVLIDGRLHRGGSFAAGEVWNIPLRGAPLEEAVSGPGVVRAYAAAGGNVDGLEGAGDVADLARKGDAAAAAAWRSFAEDLAFLSRCALSLLDPERIVIGGSVAASRELFDAPLRAAVGPRAGRLVYAELGPAAGVIGAAALNIDLEQGGATSPP
jgi:glucokinase